MLNKLRNFTKTKLATVLIGIIIIPFVFWGMGGVFQGGNTNNIAKIKNVNISTEDFFDHIRSLGINEEIISKNIENNILTEILNDLLAKKFIGTKRFGLDGGEAVIPAMEQIIKRGGNLGVKAVSYTHLTLPTKA